MKVVHRFVRTFLSDSNSLKWQRNYNLDGSTWLDNIFVSQTKEEYVLTVSVKVLINIFNNWCREGNQRVAPRRENFWKDLAEIGLDRSRLRAKWGRPTVVEFKKSTVLKGLSSFYNIEGTCFDQSDQFSLLEYAVLSEIQCVKGVAEELQVVDTK